MVNKMCSIHRKKKVGEGSNGHITVGKGEGGVACLS